MGTAPSSAKATDDWEAHWASYADSNTANPAQVYRRKLIFEALGLGHAARPVRLLELGSGQGEFARDLLSVHPDVELCGLDLAATGVEFARRKVPQASFFQQDFTRPMAIPDKYRGWATHAVCSEVLEHLDDPAAVLANVRTLMAPGCRLVITVPAGPMSAFDRHIGHRGHFTAERLAQTLRTAGLRRRRSARRRLPLLQPLSPGGRGARREVDRGRRRRGRPPAAAGGARDDQDVLVAVPHESGDRRAGLAAGRRRGTARLMALQALGQLPLVRKLARTAADWVDIQLSLIVASLRDVAPQARGRLLDVGCGNKPYESFFRPYVTEYLGIEHEATFAATAAGAQGTRPDLTYDGDRLPFADQTFDTVLSVQVLEHTPRPRALVAEMARVLKSGGLLILLAPFQFRLHEEPHDYYRYSSHGLRHLCEEAGLQVVEIRPQGSLWSVIGHKLNSYLAFRVGARRRDGADAGQARP